MSLVKLTDSFSVMTTKLTLFLLLNEEILEPIRVSRNISVVYNPILSVRIAPVYMHAF